MVSMLVVNADTRSLRDATFSLSLPLSERRRLPLCGGYQAATNGSIRRASGVISA